MRITGGEGVDLVDRRARPDLVPQGLPAAAPGRAAGDVRALGGSSDGKRDIPATLKSLVSMPLATMPWWKSLL